MNPVEGTDFIEDAIEVARFLAKAVLAGVSPCIESQFQTTRSPSLPNQCLFVIEQQGFVGGIEGCLFQLGRGGIEPDGGHKADGLPDLTGKLLLLLAGGKQIEGLAVPGLDLLPGRRTAPRVKARTRFKVAAAR